VEELQQKARMMIDAKVKEAKDEAEKTVHRLSERTEKVNTGTALMSAMLLLAAVAVGDCTLTVCAAARDRRWRPSGRSKSRPRQKAKKPHPR
jgi:hypothetical protein